MPSERDRVESADGMVVLVGAMFQCTCCRKVRPASLFGLRQMADGVYRNQSQCADCRSSVENAA